ncbi:MAG: cyclic nucleotide-binding domain-containing protein [Elusimicrobia bacterium]|nr:cyclic nucleotide-binding domain-containing protein [Elusimicrobiota bacterium]
MSSDSGNGFVTVPVGEKEYRWLEKGLRGLGFFARLDLRALSGILPYVSLVEFAKGRPVCREGDEGDGFYLIYQGAVEVRKAGWDKPVATLGPGEFFGEMALLFKQPRNATVRALKSTRLFWLQTRDFKKVLGKNPSVARTIRKVAEERRKALARH